MHLARLILPQQSRQLLYVVHRAFSHCQQLAGAGLHDFISPRTERKANGTGVMLYLDIKVAAIWAVFLFFYTHKVSSHYHICVFLPFIAPHRRRPALKTLVEDVAVGYYFLTYCSTHVISHFIQMMDRAASPHSACHKARSFSIFCSSRCIR